MSSTIHATKSRRPRHPPSDDEGAVGTRARPASRPTSTSTQRFTSTAHAHTEPLAHQKEIPSSSRTKSIRSFTGASFVAAQSSSDESSPETTTIHITKSRTNTDSKRRKMKETKERRVENPRPPPAPPKDVVPVQIEKGKGEKEKASFSGPIAQAEFERMKLEMERLKAAVLEGKRTIKLQTKHIDELKTQVNGLQSDKKASELQVQTLKVQSRDNEELISTIEQTMLCQVCMDLLINPFALSPCGHVLCLTCLQEWFRQAPPSEEDMEVDAEDDPHYILRRNKSCPCCRSTVKKRPAPVFVVKAVAAALLKNKDSAGSAAKAPDASDPWDGLFPGDSESGSDDYGYNDYMYEISDDDSEMDDINEIFYNPVMALGAYHWGPEHEDSDEEGDEVNGSGSEESEGSQGGSDSDQSEVEVQMGLEFEDEDAYDYEVDPDLRPPRNQDVYVAPQWTPPTHRVVVQDHDVEDDVVQMLRRGCTPEMIERFAMTYSHGEGLVAYVNAIGERWLIDSTSRPSERRRLCRMFLGWTVKLMDDDQRGLNFMEKMMDDVQEFPERWSSRRRGRGGMDATRLVTVASLNPYDDTNSDHY